MNSQQKQPEEMLAALKHSIALLESDRGKDVDWYGIVSKGTSSTQVVIREETVSFRLSASRANYVEEVVTNRDTSTLKSAGWSGSRESNSLLWLIKAHSGVEHNNTPVAFSSGSVGDLNQD
jgi:hypothetical protein